jgi:hypothetical protein
MYHDHVDCDEQVCIVLVALLDHCSFVRVMERLFGI